MLSWIFKKKKDTSAAAVAAPTAQSIQAAAAATAAQAAAKQTQQAASDAVWSDRLSSALGNDQALLALAKEAPSVNIKLAAVRALANEASLQLAEREFRTHDRRVHQAAKQRHAALKARRDTGERASRLIESAAALLNESVIPANRLVELDRAWQALDATLVDDTQKAGFAEVSAQLTAVTHARGERQAALQRWAAQAAQTLAQLDTACAAAAAGSQSRDDLAAASDAARQAHAAMPEHDQPFALGDSLLSALAKAAAIEERLAFLDELQRPATAMPSVEPPAIEPVSTPLAEGETPPPGTTDAAEPAGEPADDAALATSEPTPAPVPAATKAAAVSSAAFSRWKALPVIADADIARLLDDRFDEWKRAQAPRRPPAPNKRPSASDTPKPPKQDRSAALEPVLQQAEAALAGGHLADIHRHLMAMEHIAPPDALIDPAQHTRLNAVQAEYARLKGWQQWGGGRARDDLVLEAEALASSTAAAEAGGTKLPIKSQADAIDELRKRWKELDRLGGATSQTLWKRFDEALKLSYLPVAAHLAQLEATRQANLAARNMLLDALEAVPLVDPETLDADELPSRWKDLSRALDHFQLEWRKLGPVEHTVPRKAHKALLDRLSTSLARVESPLREARRAAQAEREQLVARARALSTETPPHPGELVNRVRELQAEWQQHARTLPLTRQVENALWTEFKAATDAVFAQREAAFTARDAVFKEHEAAREALIERVEALTADTPVGEIKRTLANVNAQWRNTGEASRQHAGALDNRFRNACAVAQGHVADSAQRLWRGTCDALLDKLTLCEKRESDVDADIESAWAALPALPPLWERTLAERKAAPVTGQADGAAIDTALLQLEAALDLPSPAEHQAARRELKLLAMKAALEGRQAPGDTASIDHMIAGVLGRQHLNDTQRARLRNLVAGLRAGAPRTRG